MSINLTNIIYTTLNEMLNEQQEAEETNSVDVFTEPQQKFLSSFAKAGSQHIGVIYSVSEIGIREFIARSGKQYNVTPAVLLSLIRGKYIKIVPYTGYGRDTDYTLELRLPMDAVEKYKDKFSDKKSGGDASAVDMEGGAPLPGPELAHVVKYGDILKESEKIAKKLINEASKKKNKKKSSKEDEIKIHLNKSRILSRVPKDFIFHLKRVIKMLRRKTFNKTDQERLIADILDNLQLNFNLTKAQMIRSFEFHKNQKRLQKFLDKD
jgi:hypothetical protein